MVRNQYSYWLTVVTKNGTVMVHTFEEIKAALEASDMATSMVFEIISSL